MTTRYTVTDVRHAFGHAKRAAESVGIDTSDWLLAEGNATQGRPYRLQGRDGTGTRDLGFTSGNGFLGTTARQARDTLYAYASAWWAVVGLTSDQWELVDKALSTQYHKSLRAGDDDTAGAILEIRKIIGPE